MSKKRIIVAVSNDLTYDQRVRKVCQTLFDEGYAILLVGRLRKSSDPINRPYKTKRLKLIFEKGALFYAMLNLRLFFYMLFQKCDAIHSNDLDTLLACRMVAKIKRKPLIYDSHEYFLGVPEIQERPKVKKVWTKIERSIFPKLKHVFTVNDSIAELYEKDYGIRPEVIRNIPNKNSLPPVKTRQKLNLPEDKKIVILQGAGINIDRGAEELLEAITIMENTLLLIVGTGDVIDKLKARALKADLKDKVIFTGRLPYNEMMQYTQVADVGVTLDKDTNINYKFSLPNKIFDYLNAGIPVLATNLPEIKKIITGYTVGLLIDNLQPDTIKKGLETIWKENERYLTLKVNAQKASNELNWENDASKLVNTYRNIFER